MEKRRDRILGIALSTLLAVAAALQATAYWPGLMTWDAIRQYGQAIDGDFDDWHPPAMEWLWRQLIPLHAGPAPMLVLQLALYWGGFALLVGWAVPNGRRPRARYPAHPELVEGCFPAFRSTLRQAQGERTWMTGRPVAAILLTLAALLPIPFALMGAVLKDCLMAGALLVASGLLAWLPERGRWPLRALGIALLIAAATLRFNALPACLPLMLALLPRAWRQSRPRLAAAALISALALAAAMPLANRLIGAEKSGVELSLVMFDLGGITEGSGKDQFPEVGVPDPVAVNHHCYSPVKWDPYSWWVDEPCPIGFERARTYFAAHHRSAYGWWLRGIAAHPLAYASHRLRHFNINARFLVHDEIERPVQLQGPPNDWGYRERLGPIQRAIDLAARASAHSPLGWPIWWLALAAGCLILAPALPTRRLVMPIAASALLYGLSYLAFSVAAELRYHLWTMLGAAIAAAFAIGDLASGASISRNRLLVAGAPLLVVTLLCTVWRLLPA